MKALSKLKPEKGIWMTDVPKPEILPGQVLIKIKKTAICGTDLHIYNWDEWAQKTIPVPMVTGHEYVGEIVEVGSNAKGFEIGDRVSGEGHIVCGFCRNCRGDRTHLCRNTQGIGVNVPGAFAENLAIPARNAFKIPDGIDDDVVSIFDPFGNAVHTALSFEMVGEDVLITGAGPIGMMAVKIARHVGARHVVITDINDYRLDMAKKLGATATINVKGLDHDQLVEKIKDTMNDIGMTEGFDVGLEMSGNGLAINSMINTMNNGGRLALLGIPGKAIQVNWEKIIWHGLFLKGIYGREMFETWYKMVALLQSGLDISDVITHRFDIDDYQKGFETMAGGQCGKVILNWC